MEMKDLLSFTLVLVLVGMILGVGVLTLDKVGTAARTATAVLDDRFVATNASYVSLNNTNITTSSARFENATKAQAIASSCFTWDKTGTYAGQSVRLNSGACSTSWNGKTVNVSYTYGAESQATDAMLDVSDAIKAVSTTWLSLIVTIVVLAIILTIVIRSFSMRR